MLKGNLLLPFIKKCKHLKEILWEGENLLGEEDLKKIPKSIICSFQPWGKFRIFKKKDIKESSTRIKFNFKPWKEIVLVNKKTKEGKSLNEKFSLPSNIIIEDDSYHSFISNLAQEK